MFAEETKKTADIPAAVANTFLSLTAQSKVPNWCLFSGLDPQKIKASSDLESGYTIPRAWTNREEKVFFVSPFFLNQELIVPLCFFGRNFNRSQVITLNDVDSGKGYRVHLKDLQNFCGYADKEVFNLVGIVV
ncbi:MAG: hypothetical protein QNJ38_01395 [Prochloraceae cyanobacterium]|nr:hypothetical protein [Prochloraceae cyanobacterium]